MKTTILSLFAVLAVACLGSCSSDFLSGREKFAEVENKLISRFGENAYYVKILVTSADSGDAIRVSCVSDPAAKKLEGWTYEGGKWRQTADILIVSDGDVDPKNFMFNVGTDVRMEILWDLAEKSRQVLVEEGKQTGDIKVLSVEASIPNGLHKSELRYEITIAEISSGAETVFTYDAGGNLSTRLGK